ncbi:helix-turn-helix domain-containing protein [Natronorubrum sp. JWXQ-INN-674]|uniref:Helix-turn-helix domain-containing protein n=1 Tax=Natronorubrum halalkaliphilum TaxID=2691917 RepID=A0A6B0VMM6_9EURY|nr:IclR family transcriptional regulator [Natronorubrum halalkaliphilum]MXV62728.1 helix-turn-helix domain-containing protein [Natronorubrum halalkaliphilum]
MNDASRSPRPVTTTESSLRILEFLKRNPGQTLEELSDELDLARSTIHRHLLTLEDNDLLVREDGAFYVALRFLDFGISARNRVPFFDDGRRQVDRLAEETGEKVWLVAKEGDFSVHLYKASGDSPLRTSARVGQRRYLHQLAAGKAILANLDEDELQAIIDRQGLVEMTEQTITDEESLREELAAIRDRGYAFNISESIEGLNAVGAPIRDDDGTPIGGISISGPANRVKGDYLRNELPDKLLAAIDEIHINLRYGSSE